MDYGDFRPRPAAPYGGGGGGAIYPSIGQPGPPPPARPAPHLSSGAPSPTVGIRVAIKPECRISPPPPLAPQMPDIPRSTFQFDFDFEKGILAEAEKESHNWSKVTVDSQRAKPVTSAASASSSPMRTSMGDPIVEKYVASGLSRESVPLAVQNYGDNPPKVREFVKGYNLLREMGFSSKNVAEALAMYDNDTDKALAYLLNSSS